MLELKKQLTAAKTQMLILLLHNAETFPTPGKLEGEGFQARAHNIHPSIVEFSSSTVVYIFSDLESIIASV